MTIGLVGQDQITTFTSPVNGTSPIDANVVRGNDNTVKTAFNVHDADASVHLQSSAASARPPAGVPGRKWLDADTYRLYYDDGAAWHELAYVGTAGAATINGKLTVVGDVQAERNLIAQGPDTAATGVILANKIGTSTRWYLSTDGAVEGAGDAGENLVLGAYSNAGTLIDQPIGIERKAGGKILVTRPVTVTPSLTVGIADGSSRYVIVNSTGASAGIVVQTNGVNQWVMGRGVVDGSNNFNLLNAVLGSQPAISVSIADNTVTLGGKLSLPPAGFVEKTSMAGGTGAVLRVNAPAETFGAYSRLTTANNDVFMGVENNVGNSMAAGASPGAVVINSLTAGRTIEFFTSNTKRLAVTDTGVIVSTGGLDATGYPGAITARSIGSTGDTHIRLIGGAGSGHLNWDICKSYTVANALQFIPSTVVDGTTFSTPVMTLSSAGQLSAVTFNATVTGGITAYFIGGRAILRNTGVYNVLMDPNGQDGVVVGDNTDPNVYLGGNNVYFRNRAAATQYGFWGPGGLTVNVGPILVPTGQAVLLANEAASTLSKYMTLTNAGSNAYMGIEGAAGSTLLSGASPYAFVLGTAVPSNVEFFTNNAKRMTISATGGFGFFGVAPVARPVVTTAASIAQVVTALQNLGLFSP